MLPELGALHRMILFVQNARPEELDNKALQLAALGVSPGPLSEFAAVQKPTNLPNSFREVIYSSAAKAPPEAEKKAQTPGLTSEQIAMLQGLMPKPPQPELPRYVGGTPSQVRTEVLQPSARQPRPTLYDIIRGSMR